MSGTVRQPRVLSLRGERAVLASPDSRTVEQPWTAAALSALVWFPTWVVENTRLGQFGNWRLRSFLGTNSTAVKQSHLYWNYRHLPRPRSPRHLLHAAVSCVCQCQSRGATRQPAYLHSVLEVRTGTVVGRLLFIFITRELKWSAVQSNCVEESQEQQS